MEDLRIDQWRNINATTKFPFAESASLSNGVVAFLDSTLLDASFYPIGAVDFLFVSKVAVTHDLIRISMGDANEEEICYGEFDAISPGELVRFQDRFGRPAGIIISEPNRLALFQSWGIGSQQFTRAQTEICATCFIPTPEIGIRGIVLPDGSVMTGDVWLIGDNGVALRADKELLDIGDPSVPKVVKTIRVDVVGDPLFRRRLCQPNDLFQTPRFIKTIRVVGPNGTFECTPDSQGNINLIVNNYVKENTVLRVTDDGNGLVIKTVGSTL